MITSPNFNRSFQVGPRRGGYRKQKKKGQPSPEQNMRKWRRPIFRPKKQKGSVRVAQTHRKMDHKSTSKSVKEQHQKPQRNQSGIKREVWLTLTEFRRYHEGEKPSKPCKGCSKSDFGEMRCTRLTNTVWAWFKAQKMTQKRTQRP